MKSERSDREIQIQIELGLIDHMPPPSRGDGSVSHVLSRRHMGGTDDKRESGGAREGTMDMRYTYNYMH